MALPIGRPIYGIITDSGGAVSGASVYIQDTTTPGAILNGTTNADGKYIIDVQSNINADGDSIKVWSFEGGRYGSDTDVINLTNRPERVDILIASIALSDTLTISDSIATSVGFNATLSDTLTIADAIATAVGFNVSLADTLAIADAISTLLIPPSCDKMAIKSSMEEYYNITSKKETRFSIKKEVRR